jgi:actin-like ATPase involved in cell morphogenesis
MQAIGVDLGFGVTKVASALGRVSFSSAWAPHVAGAEAWGIGMADRPLMMDGRAVLVGDRAASGPGARRPFADGRLADPEALPLLGAALWRAGVQGDVCLGSGTPLGMFARERETARAALEGRTLTLADGSHETRVRIARLVLRPQGVGAALFLAAQGRLPGGAGYVVVLDVGTRTTDVLTLEAGDLSPVMPLCFSLEAGVATAAEALAAEAQAATGHLPPADVSTAALREPRTWRGRPVGGPAEAAPHLDALAAGIRAEVQRRFGAEAGRVAVVALVGGGGVLLRERLAGALPGECLAVADEDAVFSNAEGFRWAAERAATALGVS